MKHFGSKMVHSAERSDEMMREYDKLLRELRHIEMPDVYQKIASSPSSRFWVSDTRAALVVATIMKGDNTALDKMNPLKKEMYLEIYRRTKEIQRTHPHLSLSELCARVVMQPAPKLYLTPGSVKIMVCKAREKWKERKRAGSRQS